jgi:hypothetical protein
LFSSHHPHTGGRWSDVMERSRSSLATGAPAQGADRPLSSRGLSAHDNRVPGRVEVGPLRGAREAHRAARGARRVAAAPRRFVKGVHCHGCTAIGTGVPGAKRRGAACRPGRSARASGRAAVAGGRGHGLVPADGRAAEPGGGGLAAVPGGGA